MAPDYPGDANPTAPTDTSLQQVASFPSSRLPRSGLPLLMDLIDPLSSKAWRHRGQWPPTRYTHRRIIGIRVTADPSRPSIQVSSRSVSGGVVDIRKRRSDGSR